MKFFYLYCCISLKEGVMIYLVIFMGFRVIMETNLGQCPQGINSLTAVGKPAVNVGRTITWAWALDRMWREVDCGQRT